MSSLIYGELVKLAPISFPTKKILGSDGFTGEFYQISSKSAKVSPRTEKEGTHSNLFYEVKITLSLKSDIIRE